MNTAQTTIARSLAARAAGLWIILLFTIVAAAPAAAHAPGLVGQRLADAAERYEADKWPVGPVRTGLSLAALSIDGYSGGMVEFTPGAPVVRHFAGDDGVDRFLVEVSVRETVDQARTALLEYLASVSSPHKVPTLASLDIVAGDVGYAGRAPGKRIAWIAFLRGNIACRIVCLDPRADPHPEMGVIAAALDREILHRPVTSSKDLVPRVALVSAIVPSRTACRAGEVLPLVLHLADKSGSPAAVRWVVGGPGQGYVEQDASGIWQLHTTKEGAIELTCHVLGPNGFTDSASIALEVNRE